MKSAAWLGGQPSIWFPASLSRLFLTLSNIPATESPIFLPRFLRLYLTPLENSSTIYTNTQHSNSTHRPGSGVDPAFTKPDRTGQNGSGQDERQKGAAMNIIKAVNLVYDYIKRDEEDRIEEVKRAIDHVDLEIEKGSFVAVLGHNGSGKSTLAKHLNGILLPTEGTIWVSDLDTSDEEALWEVRKTAGMVFQNPDNQIIGNVVEEDVGFGPENIGVPTEEIWRRVDESLEKVGMAMYRKRSPNRLSGGQKQRVAIAGVMAMKPQCIVLDEPTAMLDPNGRKEVIRTVHDLNRAEGITVILITHYMEEVIGADRVIVMEGGSVVMDGTPREIFSSVERLKEWRLDVPQVTELAFELKKKGVALPDGILTREELIEALVPLLEHGMKGMNDVNKSN